MTKQPLPPREYLIQCFDYDPETGRLAWKVRPLSHFVSSHAQAAWNGRYAGHEITCRDVHGYIVCQVGGGLRRAHRIIWVMLHGVEPDEIDHIDGDPGSNREANLRECSHAENMRNLTSARKNNTSGVKGVHRHQGKWRAMIRFEGTTRHIGVFDTVEAASIAYQAEAARRFGEFVRQP